MPSIFKKSRRFRRRFNGRRIRRRFGSRRPLRKFSRSVRRIVRNMSETKWTTSGNQTDTTAAGALGSMFARSLLPAISQGTTKVTRIGNRIRLSRLTIKWQIDLQVDFSVVTSAIIIPWRVFLVGNRGTATTPTIANFFEDFTTADIVFVSSTNTNQYKIIKEWRGLMSNFAAQTGYQSAVHGKISLPWIKNLNYSASGTQQNNDAIPFLVYWVGVPNGAIWRSADLFRMSFVDI